MMLKVHNVAQKLSSACEECDSYIIKLGLVARTDTPPPGMRTVVSSIFNMSTRESQKVRGQFV